MTKDFIDRGMISARLLTDFVHLGVECKYSVLVECKASYSLDLYRKWAPTVAKDSRRPIPRTPRPPLSVQTSNTSTGLAAALEVWIESGRGQCFALAQFLGSSDFDCVCKSRHPILTMSAKVFVRFSLSNTWECFLPLVKTTGWLI